MRSRFMLRPRNSTSEAVLADSAPKLVSLRFCSLVLGLNYSQTTNLMIKSRVFATTGKLRAWKDVLKAFQGRLIPPKTLQALMKHVDPAVQAFEPTIVPASLVTALRKAWKRLGVPGSEFVVAEGKAKPTEKSVKVQSDEEDEEEPLHAKMERAKLRVQEENLAYRQLQTQRMKGMMVDRAAMRARARVQGIMIQRFLVSLPAVVTGELVKVAALSDGQLRAVERTLQDLVPRLIAELRRETAEADKDAAAIASSHRYGERAWTSDAEAA
jgi:hypothetical protein